MYTGEFFAVKELTLDKASGARCSLLDDICRESSLLQSLKHENIVSFIGTERTAHNLYLFTEYIAGVCMCAYICVTVCVPSECVPRACACHVSL